jgi:DNA-directed RNA polymerase specialized sigma24 family protein
MEGLPPREADFIDLYYFRRLKQTDIAAIFGVSQPTVCYRLQRAAARIAFLVEMPDVDGGRMREALQDLLPDPLDTKILLLMRETTCQSEVAKRLGVSQGLVRHRFLRSLNRMRGVEGYEELTVIFDFVAENLNILREVQRPAWGAQITHTID